MLFLPTPSARRATGGFSYFNSNSRNFYPRPPRGGRRHTGVAGHLGVVISTHALREEGDRLPAAGPTEWLISTHALREEGDGQVQRGQPGRKKISTHALREEGDMLVKLEKFGKEISTHALREEGDGLRPAAARIH